MSADVKPQVVLAVSQLIDPCDAQDRPEREFEKLSRLLGATVVGQLKEVRGSAWYYLEKKTGLDFSQAVKIIRQYPEADAYVSFSERIGIPLGILFRMRRNQRPFHILIAHHLNTKFKKLLRILTGWSSGVNRIIVLCRSQLPFAQQLVLDEAVFIRAGVADEKFYRPIGSGEENYILAVGSEQRDYGTLVEASAQLEVSVKILSSSPWSRKKGKLYSEKTGKVEFLPKVSYAELRRLYDSARLVVVPLFDVDYAAGHNAILEAFCMKKAVVVSASRGIMDYVEHLRTAFLTCPGNSDELSNAIKTVVGDSLLRQHMGATARQEVERELNLHNYAHALAKCVYDVLGRDYR